MAELVESARLEIECTANKRYRGFESHSLRHKDTEVCIVSKDKPDDNDGERAYQLLRKAPDYRPELDLSVVDENNEIASFTTVWYDESNRIGMLEPVGTIPSYRRMGLAKAVIFEGINRIRKLGAKKIYVGSDQKFYLSIGFTVEYEKEVWQKPGNDSFHYACFRKI